MGHGRLLRLLSLCTCQQVSGDEVGDARADDRTFCHRRRTRRRRRAVYTPGKESRLRPPRGRPHRTDPPVFNQGETWARSTMLTRCLPIVDACSRHTSCCWSPKIALSRRLFALKGTRGEPLPRGRSSHRRAASSAPEKTLTQSTRDAPQARLLPGRVVRRGAGAAVAQHTAAPLRRRQRREARGRVPLSSREPPTRASPGSSRRRRRARKCNRPRGTSRSGP